MPASIEETALATDALAKLLTVEPSAPEPEAMRRAVARGAGWLIERTNAGRHTPAAPIGLYFAKLWYSERLYPLIFTASALARAAAVQ